jgi:O-antigen ligase
LIRSTGEYPTRTLAVAGPVLIAAAVWAVGLGATAGDEALPYLLPLTLPCAAAALLLLVGAVRGGGVFIGCLLVAVLFGLSLTFRDREIGEPGLDLQNGFKLVVWLIVLSLSAVHWRKLRPLLNEPASLCALGFIMVSFVSSFWSLLPGYSAGNAVGILAYLCLAALAFSAMGEDKAFRVTIWSLLALVGVGLAAAVVVPDLSWLISIEEPPRLRGLSGHPNVFAQQAGLLFTLGVVARRRRLIRRSLFAVSLTLSAPAILLTGGRTTLTAVALAWVVVALNERSLLRYAVAAGCVIVPIMTFVAANDLTPDLSVFLGEVSRSGSKSELMTLTGRTELWAVAWEKIQARPLFGWGFNAIEGLLQDSLPSTFYGSRANTHNMFVQSVFTLGFVGSLPGFGLLGILVWRMFRRPDAMRDQMTISLLITGMSEVAIFSVPTLLTFVVFLFLAREAALHADDRVVIRTLFKSSEHHHGS